MDQKLTPLVFYVNQLKIEEANPNPEETLISYLRRKLLLTGTKLACGEGGCGACTVMVSRVVNRGPKQEINHLAVNACLAPLVSVHGTSVTTVEGISNGKNGLHALQERLSKAHGSQCGFCTPGIIMSAYSVLRSKGSEVKNEDFEEAMQGNLCRCTGYRPILDALKSFSKSSSCCGNPDQCCKTSEKEEDESETRLFNSADFLPYQSDQEPIFPNELQLTDKYDNDELFFKSPELQWYRPVSLRRLLELKAMHPNAKLVNGNTEIGIEVYQRKTPYPVVIQTTNIQDLQKIKIMDGGLKIGAAATLTNLLDTCEKLLADSEVSDRVKRVPTAFKEMLHWFAGPQIRNVSSVGGNVMTASPISDLNPLFMSMGAKLTLQSKESKREVILDDNFFVGYRKTRANNDEVLTTIYIPFTKDLEYFYGFKQARRREDDISIVNAGMRVLFHAGDDNELKVSDAKLVFGGMAPVTKTAQKSSALMVNQSWNSNLLATVTRKLDEEFQLAPNAPGGQVSYRKTLVQSFFRRFYHLILEQFGNTSADKSSTDWIDREVSSANQIFQAAPNGQLMDDPIGRPIAHVSATKQTTGEAVYIDDLPEFSNELFMAPVLSTVASARIKSISYEAALSVPGVVGIADHNDVQKDLRYGVVEKDEHVFAEEFVSHVGDMIAVVLARDREVAKKAASKVKVEYEDVCEPIVTITDAIEASSFFNVKRHLVTGDVQKAFSEAATKIEGEIHIGGQEHFYFEPNACVVIPKEDGELEVFLASQNPTYAQQALATITGFPQSRINVRVKRLGGGFGGKETRPMLIAGPAAVCARKFGRPVRSVLDRDVDMMISGTRHPVYAQYKMSADSMGHIQSFQVRAYLNAGCTLDLSFAVAECVVWKSIGAYLIPNVDINAILCKTNLPSNTAFRGFGAPQAVAIVEKAVSELAEKVGMSQTQFREINFQKTKDVRPYGQAVKNCTVQRSWFQCKHSSDYDNRVKVIKKFNEGSRYKKKGIFLSPLCYGIGFGHKFSHQAGALVNIYTDGSVLITHGGVEMGQGLHTKLIQVASRVLNIPIERIYISETATDKVPNTTSSAASMTADLNAPAVMDACKQLKARLAHFMHENPKSKWEDWVLAAYLDGVNLSAQGFFHGPEPHFDDKTMRGEPFIYYVYGAACSEVELDALTGDHVVKRVDLVMDLGASLNPAIDIGQIEGAFVQGYGLYTLEDLRHTPDGRLISRGPGAYKIPGFSDIPEQFNVQLLSGSLCEYPKAVYSSKAVGEPPLCLAVSALSALRDAVIACRKEFGVTLDHKDWSWRAPATSENLRLAVGDDIAKLSTSRKSEQKTSALGMWEVKLCD